MKVNEAVAPAVELQRAVPPHQALEREKPQAPADRTAASRSEAVSGRTIGPTAHRTIHPATAEGASAVNRLSPALR